MPARSCTPTTRRPAARCSSSRTTSPTSCCRCTPTPTPSRREPACRPADSGRTPVRSSPSASGRPTSTPCCSAAADRRRRSPRWSVSSASGFRRSSTIAHHLTAHIPADDRPVVFIGPYEHHSNELPWRESIADVVTIDEDIDGHVDLAHLEAELERHRDRPQLIGSFSAASNVTGIITDIGAVSSLLHRYGAIALWDYAAAAPYVRDRRWAPRPRATTTSTRSSSRRTS